MLQHGACDQTDWGGQPIPAGSCSHGADGERRPERIFEEASVREKFSNWDGMSVIWLLLRPDDQNNRDGHLQVPSLSKVLQMAADIADGMAYLGNKKIVHRYIQREGVLLLLQNHNRARVAGIWLQETACSLQTPWSKLATLGWLGTSMRRSTTEKRAVGSFQFVGWLPSQSVTGSSQASLTCGAMVWCCGRWPHWLRFLTRVSPMSRSCLTWRRVVRCTDLRTALTFSSTWCQSVGRLMQMPVLPS